MMKKGFALLSMLVAMILGSILISSMFMIYNGISNSVNFVQRVSSADTREVVIIDRFQRDFLGLATMWNNLQTKSNNGEPAASSTATSKDEIKNKFFYSINNGDSLDFLTCITTSRLSSFDDIRPYFVRVVYRVESDPLRKEFFRLMRKEIATVSDKVTEEDLKGGFFSELAYGIRSIKMHYYFLKKSEETTVKAQAVGQSSSRSFEEISEWNPNDEKMKEKTSDIVPYAIKIDMVFEDNGKQQEVNFRVDIFSDVSLGVKLPQPANNQKLAPEGSSNAA